MENYKEKIKKLLALSESSNEHEAKAALLKAKQLMIEHKITESDLTDRESKVKKIKSGVTYSARRDPWIPLLADTLARNYLCQFVRFSRKGMQTKGVGFWGLEDDAEICTKVFEYAVDCIHSECKKIKKMLIAQHRKEIVCAADMHSDLSLVLRKPLRSRRNQTRQNGD